MQRDTQRTGTPTVARALTLVEALVVMGVLAVILGILIPTLQHARQSSATTSTLADLRSTSQLFEMWSNDHDGEFLNAGLPKIPGDTTFLDLPDGSLGHIYWPLQSYPNFWTAAMWSWHGPDRPASYNFSYCLPCFMSPTLFRETQLPYQDWPATDYWAPQRTSSVAYPSSKGLLLATLSRGGNPGSDSFRPWGIAMIDGSTARYSYADMTPSLPGFFHGRPTENPWPVHYTINGITGRDVR
jgi:hypothetical protein